MRRSESPQLIGDKDYEMTVFEILIRQLPVTFNVRGLYMKHNRCPKEGTSTGKSPLYLYHNLDTRNHI
ncbi:hypothetical protein RSOLAG1IB_10177 [Rhizoctonia solani AG-1 IB]|uniref:Uncharacterized protein n=1 Tax=Thanatephorus cucumeris (strain AG1-IB / isolate 7/3/14) TaxID=1108050 RepID=A0A0B7FZ17_THACB|nr:hypothetical protein RSOLAG1IB_10177 [Rhizoctonia solani AG-1 IB]